MHRKYLMISQMGCCSSAVKINRWMWFCHACSLYWQQFWYWCCARHQGNSYRSRYTKPMCNICFDFCRNFSSSIAFCLFVNATNILPCNYQAMSCNTFIIQAGKQNPSTFFLFLEAFVSKHWTGKAALFSPYSHPIKVFSIYRVSISGPTDILQDYNYIFTYTCR